MPLFKYSEYYFSFDIQLKLGFNILINPKWYFVNLNSTKHKIIGIALQIITSIIQPNVASVIEIIKKITNKLL